MRFAFLGILIIIENDPCSILGHYNGFAYALESAVVNVDVVLADKVMAAVLLLLAWLYKGWKTIGLYFP